MFVVVVVIILLGLGLLKRIGNDLEYSKEAALIRENCKGETGLYTIDAHGRAHTIWDCTYVD